jgi:putative ABC transport system ATP-binding protein
MNATPSVNTLLVSNSADDAFKNVPNNAPNNAPMNQSNLFASTERQSQLQSTQSMVRAAGLSKSVPTEEGKLDILKTVNLDIKAGETIAIVGASGSGKSTLLGLLAGLDTPSAGQVWLGEREITALDEDARAKVRQAMVGFVFQSFQLLPGLTALENVMLPLELARDDAARDKARDILQRVGLESRGTHYPRQLSGGEQQRVAIARAFVMSPKILFADEPTGNLDTANGSKMMDLLFKLNSEQQATLVLVTHDLKLAQRCNRQLEIAAGELVRDSNANVLAM